MSGSIVRRRQVRRVSPLLVALLLSTTALVSPAPGARGVATAMPMAVGGPRAADTTTLGPALRAALTVRLDSLRKKYAMPGVSAAVIFPDGQTWLGVSGVADLSTKAPVTTDTAFAIASITKTFTAALILALEAEGRLLLDAPVVRYLPALDIDPAITVRQLLDHTSGLRDFFIGPKIDAALLKDRDRVWGADDALGYVGKPYFKPGRDWHYSNTNYLILGMLAEKVGGAPLADQWRTRFTVPLSLWHTFYQPTETPAGPVARGYRFKSAAKDAAAIDLSDGTSIVPFTSVITAAGGAGGIASNAMDIARWARALYTGRALPEAAVRAMVGDVALTARHKPRVPYGLGVQAVEIDGRRTLGHSGRFLGFRSVVRWLPDEDITVAVLTNQSRTDPGIVARALLKLSLTSP